MKKLAIILPDEPVEDSIVLTPDGRAWQRREDRWARCTPSGTNLCAKTWRQLICEEEWVKPLYVPWTPA